MLQAVTWSALLLVGARSVMVVAALGQGEIHFHLHFTLHFTLNCVFILVQLKSKVVLFLKYTVLLNFISFYIMFYLVLIYTSVKLTFITQKYVIFLLAVLGHRTGDIFLISFRSEVLSNKLLSLSYAIVPSKNY